MTVKTTDPSPGQIIVIEDSDGLTGATQQYEALVGAVEKVDGGLRLLLFCVLPKNVFGKERLPVACPSRGISVACDSFMWARFDSVQAKGTAIKDDELQRVVKAAEDYQQKLKSTNLVSLLMVMLHQVVPCLREEFAAVEKPCKGRTEAIHRLRQMDEILEFVIAVVEANKVDEWKILGYRRMPLPSPNYSKSDLASVFRFSSFKLCRFTTHRGNLPVLRVQVDTR